MATDPTIVVVDDGSSSCAAAVGARTSANPTTVDESIVTIRRIRICAINTRCESGVGSRSPPRLVVRSVVALADAELEGDHGRSGRVDDEPVEVRPRPNAGWGL